MKESHNCEDCWYWEYDEEMQDEYCMMDLDEDEYEHIFGAGKPCPYFRQADDYYLPKKQ